MSALGQLHALPRRSIAVCFTPVSGIDSRSQGLPSRANSRPEQVQQTANLLGGLPNLYNPRHSDCKGRTTTGLARHRNVAAHHLTEAFADRQCRTVVSNSTRAAAASGSTTALSISGPAKASTASSDCHRVSTKNSTLLSQSRRLNCAPANPAIERSSGTTL